MKTLTNPTSETVRITIRGKDYSIEAGETSEPLREGVATKWNNTHSFLIMTDIESKTIVEEVEEVVEDIVEEVKKEKKPSKIAEVVKKVTKSKASTKKAKK